MARELIEPSGRLFNHAELVYAPGERELVAHFFEALGCGVTDTDGPFLVIHIDPQEKSFYDNCLYASEMIEEQIALEQALKSALEEHAELGERYLAFVSRFEREPQRTTHLGMRLPSVEELEDVLKRLETLESEFAGRVHVAKIIRPGDAASLDPTLIQVFIRTNLCAAGLVGLSQHFELQVRVPR